MNFKNMTLREIEIKVKSIEFMNYFYRCIIITMVMIAMLKTITEQITVFDSLIFALIFAQLFIPYIIYKTKEQEEHEKELKLLKQKYVDCNT